MDWQEQRVLLGYVWSPQDTDAIRAAVEARSDSVRGPRRMR
jgi:hypothetical protein